MPETASSLVVRAWRLMAAALACVWLGFAGSAFALDPGLSPDRYTVTGWNVDDGLPHSQIHGITQADDGFIWVTTWEGTARFDGLHFDEVEALRHPDGRRLPSRLLWRDVDGSLLVGLDNLGLMRVPQGGEPRPACTRYPALESMRYAPAADGKAWVAARDGFYRIGPDGNCVRYDPGEGMAGYEVQALLAHADGSLWIGTRRGLLRWHEGRTEQLGERLGLPQGEIRGLARSSDDAVWIVGDQGVWRHRPGKMEKLHGERAEGVIQDRQGVVWVAATESRVLRYWRGQWSVFDQAHGVRGYATGTLFEDREGLIWFGTTHGLFRIADGPVWRIGRQQGLPTDYARSLLQTADGRVWIGHSGGLSRMHNGLVETVIPGPEGGNGPSVMSLALAAGGGIWAGTYNRGVLHVGPQPGARPRFLVDADSPLATEQVRAVLEDRDGTLWIGTERGLVAWRDGRLEPQPLPGLPARPVRALHATADGGLWIGQFGGLAHRGADGHLTLFQPEQEFPAQSAFDFLSDPDGRLWIASDRGMVSHHDGRFRLFGRSEGLDGSSLFRILDDDFDNLWASGNHGVMRIPRAAFHAVEQGRNTQLELQMFGRDDGMPSRQANGGSAPAGWRMANGELWFPTAAGIAVFDPERAAAQSHADVPLAVQQVMVEGVVQPVAALHALPAGTRLAIRYAGISHRNPHGLRYRYRLYGFDTDWIEAGQAKVAAYTNLPPGDLRFEVQVARVPVDWTRPDNTETLRFQVDTPWWVRAWAVPVMLASLLLLLIVFYQALGRRQRMRARRLESEVAQRTEELSEKNRQLEDASRQREVLMEQLVHQANHDPLTGLPNRRASDRQLAAAIALADASGAPLCVAIIDIDRFKRINDRYGHQTGDRVLARVAQQLQVTLEHRPGFVARTGGEEFTVVVRDASLAEAVALLEQMRRDIEVLRFSPGDDDTLACTISSGVVERAGRESAHRLLQQADARLYEAKQRGRNRVVADD